MTAPVGALRNTMTDINPSNAPRPDGFVAQDSPDAIARLAVPTPGSHATPGKSQAPKARLRSGQRRKLSPLKRLERYLSAIFKLGRTEQMAKDAKRRIDAIDAEFERLKQDVDHVRKTLPDAQMAHFRDIKAEIALTSQIVGRMTRSADPDAAGMMANNPTAAVTLPNAEGFQLFKDSFYHRLENRYRGSFDEIRQRLRVYLPDVEAASLRTGGKPVMDIGCGRGEWLSLLKHHDIQAFGVDTNQMQINSAQQQGLDVRHGDALCALADLPDDSLSMISAHHVVEHLPFDAVAWITREAMRVLAPGGVLLFETPNTRNVLVGATTFHTDPTHLRPMPEQVLGVLFDTAGFHPVELRHLNPHERFDEFRAKPDFNEELAFLMFGPQDLAALGTKMPAQRPTETGKG